MLDHNPEVIEEQNDHMWKLQAALFHNVLHMDLKVMLEENKQENECGNLLDRVTDCMSFGALSPCPECQGQLIVSSDTGYHCIGSPSGSECKYSSLAANRVGWKIPESLLENEYLSTFKFRAFNKGVRVFPPNVRTSEASTSLSAVAPGEIRRRSSRLQLRRGTKDNKDEDCHLKEEDLFKDRDGFTIKVLAGKGRAVFTKKVFRKGDFLLLYHGEYVSGREGNRREKDGPTGYRYFFKWKGKGYCVDASDEPLPTAQRFGRLVNHGSKEEINCKMTIRDFMGQPRLYLEAIKTIPVDTELLYDYGLPKGYTFLEDSEQIQSKGGLSRCKATMLLHDCRGIYEGEADNAGCPVQRPTESSGMLKETEADIVGNPVHRPVESGILNEREADNAGCPVQRPTESSGMLKETEADNAGSHVHRPVESGILNETEADNAGSPMHRPVESWMLNETDADNAGSPVHRPVKSRMLNETDADNAESPMHRPKESGMLNEREADNAGCPVQKPTESSGMLKETEADIVGGVVQRPVESGILSETEADIVGGVVHRPVESGMLNETDADNAGSPVHRPVESGILNATEADIAGGVVQKPVESGMLNETESDIVGGVVHRPVESGMLNETDADNEGSPVHRPVESWILNETEADIVGGVVQRPVESGMLNETEADNAGSPVHRPVESEILNETEADIAGSPMHRPVESGILNETEADIAGGVVHRPVESSGILNETDVDNAGSPVQRPEESSGILSETDADNAGSPMHKPEESSGILSETQADIAKNPLQRPVESSEILNETDADNAESPVQRHVESSGILSETETDIAGSPMHRPVESSEILNETDADADNAESHVQRPVESSEILNKTDADNAESPVQRHLESSEILNETEADIVGSPLQRPVESSGILGETEADIAKSPLQRPVESSEILNETDADADNAESPVQRHVESSEILNETEADIAGSPLQRPIKTRYEATVLLHDCRGIYEGEADNAGCPVQRPKESSGILNETEADSVGSPMHRPLESSGILNETKEDNAGSPVHRPVESSEILSETDADNAGSPLQRPVETIHDSEQIQSKSGLTRYEATVLLHDCRGIYEGEADNAGCPVQRPEENSGILNETESNNAGSPMQIPVKSSGILNETEADSAGSPMQIPVKSSEILNETEADNAGIPLQRPVESSGILNETEADSAGSPMQIPVESSEILNETDADNAESPLQRPEESSEILNETEADSAGSPMQIPVESSEIFNETDADNAESPLQRPVESNGILNETEADSAGSPMQIPVKSSEILNETEADNAGSPVHRPAESSGIFNETTADNVGSPVKPPVESSGILDETEADNALSPVQKPAGSSETFNETEADIVGSPVLKRVESSKTFNETEADNAETNGHQLMVLLDYLSNGGMTASTDNSESSKCLKRKISPTGDRHKLKRCRTAVSDDEYDSDCLSSDLYYLNQSDCQEDGSAISTAQPLAFTINSETYNETEADNAGSNGHQLMVPLDNFSNGCMPTPNDNSESRESLKRERSPAGDRHKLKRCRTVASDDEYDSDSLFSDSDYTPSSDEDASDEDASDASIIFEVPMRYKACKESSETSNETEEDNALSFVQRPVESSEILNETEANKAGSPVHRPVEKCRILNKTEADNAGSPMQRPVETSQVLIETEADNAGSPVQAQSEDLGSSEQVTSTSPDKAIYKKPYRYCIFCKQLFSKLRNHLENKHKDVDRVTNAMKLGKKDRDEFFDQLKKEGILEFNKQEVKKNPANPDLQRERKKEACENSILVMCSVCSAFIEKKYKARHEQVHNKNSDSAVSVTSIPASVMLNDNCDERSEASSDYTSEILSRFRTDKIGQQCISDKMLVRIGNTMWYKVKSREDKKAEVRRQLMTDIRRLATLYQHLEKSEETLGARPSKEGSIVDLFKRCNFQHLQEAIEQYTRSGSNLKAGLKICIYYLLKTTSKILMGLFLIDDTDEKATEIARFVAVLELHQHLFFGDATYQQNKTRQEKLRRPQEQPREEDINTIRCYTLQRLAELEEEVLDCRYFLELRDLVLCRLTLFNARRGGEPTRLLVKDWQEADEGAWLNKRHLDKLDAIDRALAKELKVAYQTGKGRHLVPTLFPKDTHKSLRKLADKQVRDASGISSANLYLFPSGNGSTEHVSGWHSVNTICNKVSLVDRALITATRNRHRVSTEFALMDVPPRDREYVYKHLGHSEETNQHVYQSPLAVQEVTVVGRRLKQLDSNNEAGQYEEPHETDADNAGSSVQRPVESGILNETDADNAGSPVHRPEENSGILNETEADNAGSHVPAQSDLGSSEQVTSRGYTQWSEECKKKTVDFFMKYILGETKKKLPGRKEVEEFLKLNPSPAYPIRDWIVIRSKVMNEKTKRNKAAKQLTEGEVVQRSSKN